MQLLASILVFSLLVLDSEAIQVKYSEECNQKTEEFEDDMKTIIKRVNDVVTNLIVLL